MAAAVIVVGAGGRWVGLRRRRALRRCRSNGATLVGRWRHGRECRAVDAGVAGAVEAVAAALRSGAPLHQAIVEAGAVVAGPVGIDLRAVGADAAATGDLDGALARWAARRPTRAVRLAVSAFGIALDTGAASPRAIEGVAVSLHHDEAVMAEARALGAQARLSGVVLTAAPIAFAVLGAAGGQGSARFLAATAVGRACLVAGVALDLCGALWMRALSRRVS